MKKAVLFWLCLAAVAGGVLFHTSYQARELKEQLQSLNHAIITEQEAIQVLRAEWSYFNDPSRLEQLARTHLSLRPTAVAQMASVDVIPLRTVSGAKDGSNGAAAASEPLARGPRAVPAPAPRVHPEAPRPYRDAKGQGAQEPTDAVELAQESRPQLAPLRNLGVAKIDFDPIGFLYARLGATQ